MFRYTEIMIFLYQLIEMCVMQFYFQSLNVIIISIWLKKIYEIKKWQKTGTDLNRIKTSLMTTWKTKNM